MTETATETERVQRVRDQQAATYDRRIGFFERALFGGGREWVCSQTRGDVLELGVGTGRNLAFYPDDVRLTGIELSPEMLAIGKRRQAELGRDAHLRSGDAQRLGFDDERFDTVVSTLTMCEIPDYGRAIREAHRVLRPGGRFVLLEHVRSPSLPVRIGQRLLEPLSVRFNADHLLREPLDALREAGFEIERSERLKWGIVERIVARKPVRDDDNSRIDVLTTDAIPPPRRAPAAPHSPTPPRRGPGSAR
ncbi:MAG TPA: methyltransferase domain-containing protein [Solirubrobacterales bacterium]|nr:methyltransferase domain-containing protein [Solirubrobacterales bacterium]